MAWLGREWIAAGGQPERRQLKNVEAINAKCDPPQKDVLSVQPEQCSSVSSTSAKPSFTASSVNEINLIL